VVVAAQSSLQDAALGVGRAVLPHLAFNHRLMTRNMKAITAWMGVPKNEVLAPEGPVDPEFSVLVVRDGRGRPLCLLWNFAADNRFPQDGRISAGLPHLVQQELDARLGSHVPSLYLAGCSGNVSYSHGLEETVDSVASAVMAVQLETPCDPVIRLGCTAERMILPIRDYSQFWSKADIELKYPQAVGDYERELALLQEEGAHAVPATVQVFRLGRFALVGLPGVPFVEFALDVKARSPFLATVVAGNANEYLGYVIPRQAFDHGGFEAWPSRSTRVGPGGGEFMVEEVVNRLQELWRHRTR
jgi:neutral ceramidase